MSFIENSIESNPCSGQVMAVSLDQYRGQLMAVSLDQCRGQVMTISLVLCWGQVMTGHQSREPARVRIPFATVSKLCRMLLSLWWAATTLASVVFLHNLWGWKICDLRCQSRCKIPSMLILFNYIKPVVTQRLVGMTHRAAAVSGYRFGAPSLPDTFAEKR